uniref:Uncharacterized protein n=1 Tax=viral metagenome TaxID=1070528 RepID=A0A6C0AMI9_9ZZZZ
MTFRREYGFLGPGAPVFLAGFNRPINPLASESAAGPALATVDFLSRFFLNISGPAATWV